MRLPENTVDAWTAISLAQSGTQWIWLPTTNQQSTRTGKSPWDLQAHRRNRLLIIESKGIIERQSINFGQNARQRGMLARIEEEGLRLVDRKKRPLHGWVLYGLPLATNASPIDGTSWTSFPHWHHFACPHDLESWGMPEIGQRSIGKVKKAMTAFTDHTTNPLRTALPPGLGAPLKLAWYGHLMAQGLIGLPMPSDSAILPFLRQLVGSTRSRAEEFGYNSPTEALADEPTPANLLISFFAELAAASRHLTGVVG